MERPRGRQGHTEEGKELRGGLRLTCSIIQQIITMLGFDFQKIAKNERFKTEFDDLGPIGSGGFAEVRKVMNKNDGKLYAIKIIKLKPSASLDQTEENFYRALSEAKIHSQLNHPQILKYNGCWMELVSYSPEERAELEEEETDPDTEFQMVVQDDSFGSDGFVFGGSESEKPESATASQSQGKAKKDVIGDGRKLNDYKQIRIFMLIEPCDINLQAYIYQRSLATGHSSERLEAEWDRNLQMALEMTRGLSYLHSKRIIHRDIKLHNVLLNDKKQCKLIDFGLARKAKFWKSSIQQRKKEVTLEEIEEMEEFSKSVGTRLFSSPEQASSERYDYRTDIFSLAMVIVLLFCSFSTTHEQRELLETIRQRKLEDIGMPQKLKAVMFRSLGAENERPSLNEIQSVLRELLRQRRRQGQGLPLRVHKVNTEGQAKNGQLLLSDHKDR